MIVLRSPSLLSVDCCLASFWFLFWVVLLSPSLLLGLLLVPPSGWCCSLHSCVSSSFLVILHLCWLFFVGFLMFLPFVFHVHCVFLFLVVEMLIPRGRAREREEGF